MREDIICENINDREPSIDKKVVDYLSVGKLMIEYVNKTPQKANWEQETPIIVGLLNNFEEIQLFKKDIAILFQEEHPNFFDIAYTKDYIEELPTSFLLAYFLRHLERAILIYKRHDPQGNEVDIQKTLLNLREAWWLKLLFEDDYKIEDLEKAIEVAFG